MNQKLLLGSALLVGMASTQQALARQKKAKEQTRPNVVFILADDLGYGDLSCYGQEKFETPNIDRLAQNGMRFTQCYSGTTVSAPSRSRRPSVLGRQIRQSTPWLTERHGYDPTSAGVPGRTAGGGAAALSGGGHGGPDPEDDGLGRRHGGTAGPGGDHPHRLWTGPLLGVSAVRPDPSGPALADAYGHSVRRPGPSDGPGDHRDLRRPVELPPDGGAGGGALVPHPGAAGGGGPLAACRSGGAGIRTE